MSTLLERSIWIFQSLPTDHWRTFSIWQWSKSMSLDVISPSIAQGLTRFVWTADVRVCPILCKCLLAFRYIPPLMCRHFSMQNGECQRSDCHSNRQACRQQDPNRECEELPWFGYSKCVCQEDYIEDPLTLICRPKCVSTLQHICERVDSDNSLCNVYRCHCKANFRRNTVTGECEPFRCEYDSQCWSEGDKYRTCVNGTYTSTLMA